MRDYFLKFTLLSDATFGRGDGVAGLVDVEVQHDAYGLPYLGGRALKGLLGAECDDIVFALEIARPNQPKWGQVAERLFGKSGAMLNGAAILRVGPARLPTDLCKAIARDVHEERLTRADVLETLAALRRQTAIDPITGAPERETLRTMRIILRETAFEARLKFIQEPTEDDLALLAATVKAFRRAGTERNRGRGRLVAELYDASGQPVTESYFEKFTEAVRV